MFGFLSNLFGRSLTDEEETFNRLQQALVDGDRETVENLFKSGANPNARDPIGTPLLIVVASEQRVDCVKMLLENGADPNVRITDVARGYHDAPAIHFPATNGSAEILQVMIDAGVDVEATDGTGLRALMSAAFMGNDHAVEVLLNAGATTEAQDREGYTALMFAANGGRAGCVRLLLAHHADPHARDNQSSTPIMFAAQHGHDDCVRLLLAAGADPKVKGSHGLSAVDFAGQHHRKETLAILTQQ